MLNPTDKIFSGATTSSALTMMRTERLGDFGSLKQNKSKLLCLVRRNVGQAGKWETCPRKQWASHFFTSLQRVSPDLDCGRDILHPWRSAREEARSSHALRSALESLYVKEHRKRSSKDPQKLFVGSGKVWFPQRDWKICLLIYQKEYWGMIRFVCLSIFAGWKRQAERALRSREEKQNKNQWLEAKAPWIHMKNKACTSFLWCEWLTTGTNCPWNGGFSISWYLHIETGGLSRQYALAKTRLFSSV